jgi:hypothetical protein
MGTPTAQNITQRNRPIHAYQSIGDALNPTISPPEEINTSKGSAGTTIVGQYCAMACTGPPPDLRNNTLHTWHTRRMDVRGCRAVSTTPSNAARRTTSKSRSRLPEHVQRALEAQETACIPQLTHCCACGDVNYHRKALS